MPDAPHPRTILATHARTSFNFAARFLPQPQRADAIDLYAFFRTLDDLVDESPRAAGTQSIAAELDNWQAWLNGTRRGSGPREPLATNLSRVVNSNDIPVEVFQHMIEGLRADLEPRDIESDVELQTYCYRVASTVGHAMAHVLGATSPPALATAGKLGAAMQLTNILRDVGEDLDAGRVYLPATLLARHGLCRADLLTMRHDAAGPDDRFRNVMRGQIGYARTLYEQAIPGIWLLPRGCQLPILVAARLYRRLLTNIERHDYDTLRLRIATSRLDKAREAAISWSLVTRSGYGKQAVAESVSPAPRDSAFESQSD